MPIPSNFKIDPKINKNTAFKNTPPPRVSTQNLHAPNDWFEQLKTYCSSNKSTEYNQNSVNILSYHKSACYTELLQIYYRLNGDLDTQLNPLDNSAKQQIVNKLLEGANGCTAGFYNRVQSIVLGFSIPQNLGQLLYNVRYDLIQNIATQVSTYTHSQHGVFRRAQQLGLGITVKYDEYSYILSHARDELYSKFPQKYRWYALPSLIQEQLRSIFCSMDYDETDHTYQQRALNKIQEYLSEIFKLPKSGREYHNDLQTQKLVRQINDGQYELNWGYIKYLILRGLLSEKIITSLTEYDYTNIFFSNNAKETEAIPELLYMLESENKPLQQSILLKIAGTTHTSFLKTVIDKKSLPILLKLIYKHDSIDLSHIKNNLINRFTKELVEIISSYDEDFDAELAFVSVLLWQDFSGQYFLSKLDSNLVSRLIPLLSNLIKANIDGRSNVLYMLKNNFLREIKEAKCFSFLLKEMVNFKEDIFPESLLKKSEQYCFDIMLNDQNISKKQMQAKILIWSDGVRSHRFEELFLADDFDNAELLFDIISELSLEDKKTLLLNIKCPFVFIENVINKNALLSLFQLMSEIGFAELTNLQKPISYHLREIIETQPMSILPAVSMLPLDMQIDVLSKIKDTKIFVEDAIKEQLYPTLLKIMVNLDERELIGLRQQVFAEEYRPVFVSAAGEIILAIEDDKKQLLLDNIAVSQWPVLLHGVLNQPNTIAYLLAKMATLQPKEQQSILVEINKIDAFSMRLVQAAIKGNVLSKLLSVMAKQENSFQALINNITYHLRLPNLKLAVLETTKPEILASILSWKNQDGASVLELITPHLNNMLPNFLMRLNHIDVQERLKLLSKNHDFTGFVNNVINQSDRAFVELWGLIDKDDCFEQLRRMIIDNFGLSKVSTLTSMPTFLSQPNTSQCNVLSRAFNENVSNEVVFDILKSIARLKDPYVALNTLTQKQVDKLLRIKIPKDIGFALFKRIQDFDEDFQVRATSQFLTRVLNSDKKISEKIIAEIFDYITENQYQQSTSKDKKTYLALYAKELEATMNKNSNNLFSMFASKNLADIRREQSHLLNSMPQARTIIKVGA